jgi:hypothetical protein
VSCFRRDGLGFYAGDWFPVALVISLLILLCVAWLRRIFEFLKRKRDTDESEDESEKEYWRIHGG